MTVSWTRRCVFAITMLLAVSPSLLRGQESHTDGSLLSTKLSSFSYKGTFDEILAKLAVQVRPNGVIGFETGSPSATQISVSFDKGTTVEEVLTELCAADRRHRFVVAQDARIINVVLVNSDRLTQLLETKVAHFDMNLDTWPMNWYSRIPDFSTEVRNELEKYYAEQQSQRPGDYFASSGAGANMETDVRPPHVKLHLENVTVLGILNALAAKELDWVLSENENGSGRGVFYPVFPLGWQAYLPPIENVSVGTWTRSVFGPFPPSTHGTVDGRAAW